MAGQPGKALPLDLEEFVLESKDGVILVAFGSYMDFLPRDVVRKFCDAFTDGRNRLRVNWKMKDADLCASADGRVKLMPWVPQNDLLAVADSRVKVFVSDGGFNSIIESVYHAKPLIIFPMAFDQPKTPQPLYPRVSLSARTSAISVQKSFCPTSTSYCTIRATDVTRTGRRPSSVIDPTRRHSACPP